MQIHEILEELNLNNGSNYKMDVLRKHKDNELLKRVLKMAYDKVEYTYGITMKNVEYVPESGLSLTNTFTLEGALNVLERDFCTRNFTGHEALENIVAVLISLPAHDAKIIEKILDRDLKINMGRSNINKVFKGLVTKPIYMRCDIYGEKTAENIDFSNGALIELKADGTYREFSIFKDVEAISRSGESYSYPLIEESLGKVDEQGYLHGELTVFLDDKLLAKILPDLEKIDKKNGTNNVSEITEQYEAHKQKGEQYILPRKIGNGLLNSDDVPHDNIVYDVWDFITEEDYQLAGLKDKKNLPKETYEERFNNLKNLVKKVGNPNIRVIEHELVYSIQEALQFTSEKMKQGLEGAVLKNLGMVFKDGTSKEQLKLKLEIDIEVRCTGFTPGNKGTKNEAYFSAMTFENDEGTIKGQVGVTTMTEKERNYLFERMDECIGKVFTAQGNDLSKARGHDYYALSHPRYIEFRDDKNETDTLERAFQLREMAMLLAEEPEKFPEKYQDVEDWYVPAWYYRMVTDTMAGHPDDDIRLNAYRVGYENGVDIRWTLKDKLNLKLHENRALAQAVGEYGVTHCLLGMIDEQSAPIRNETVRLYAVSSTSDGTFVFLVTPNDDHGMEWTSTYEFPEGFVFPQEVLDHME